VRVVHFKVAFPDYNINEQQKLVLNIKATLNDHVYRMTPQSLKTPFEKSSYYATNIENSI